MKLPVILLGIFTSSCRSDLQKNQTLEYFLEIENHPEKIREWDGQKRQNRCKTMFDSSLAFANQNTISLIPAMICALKSEDPAIYHHASYHLTYFTNHPLHTIHVDSEEERIANYNQWIDWWEKNKKIFRFRHKLMEDATLIVDEIPGRLVGNNDDPPGRITYVNGQDQKIWETEKLKMPYDAVRLPDESYWVNIIRARAVIKIQSNEVVSDTIQVGGYPCSLELLDNGNLLVAGWDDSIPGFVKEFNGDGAMVWELSNLRWPWKAQRLKNGNTLIADAGLNKVYEVNMKGEEVWSVKNLGPAKPALFDSLGPVYCQRLDNGNTLISIRGLSTIVEVDKNGKIVWEVNNIIKNQYSAVRIWNGNTLIADGGNFRVIEIDYNKNIIWEKKGIGYPAKVYRY